MSDQKAVGGKLIRLSWWAGLAILMAYVGWMLTPYLYSVIVRGAAVTTSIHVATSPLRGNVVVDLPRVGERIGADGRLTVVRNDFAERRDLEETRAEVVRAEAAVRELTA